MGISLGSYFLKYPIFPAVLSGDFSQHMNTATQLAHGNFPSLSALVLYYGLEAYLGLSVFLFPAVPLQTVRLAMGLLVFVSPLIIYFSVKTLFDSKAALWSAAVYTLSGSLWFGMVFSSGLWPNFWGLLSSLLLIAAAVYLVEHPLHLKRPYIHPTNLKGPIVFSVALVNALFSHYSILLVFPALLLYFAIKKNPLGLGMTFVPLLGGLILFPSLISSLSSFGGVSTGTVPAPSLLAAIIPLPTLSFLVAEISVNALGDFAALSMLGLGGWFLWKNWKTKDSKMLLLSVWFLVALLYPVYSSNAWRFAFIGLMPLTVMGGWSLSSLIPKWPKKGHKAPYLGKTLLIGFLFLTPAFGSWANQSFFDSGSNPFQSATQQQADLQAIQWMLANVPSNCLAGVNITKCGVIVVNDFDFQYLSYMDTRHYTPPLQGLQTIYAPLSNVVFNNAFQVQLFASHYGIYILVAKNGTISSGPCNEGQTFGLRLTANTTSPRINATVAYSVDAVKGLNSTISLWDNGNEAARAQLVNGHADITASYSKAENHTILLSFALAATEPLLISVGGHSIGAGSVRVPRDYCSAWNSFNPSTLRGWTIIYQNSNVRLYKVNQ